MEPIFTNDAIVFGILMLTLGFVFYTSTSSNSGWKKFYKYVPALLMAYMLPAIFTSTGIISPEWETVNETGEITKHGSQLYYIASRFLLPAALVLMTLSIDLKAVFNLGWKALVMFFTGTIGIIIGGPIAILLISTFSPETVGGVGPDAVWRGLSTLAGSWIGGGANQTAMLEIYGYNQKLYGGMVTFVVSGGLTLRKGLFTKQLFHLHYSNRWRPYARESTFTLADGQDQFDVDQALASRSTLHQRINGSHDGRHLC